MRYEGASGPSSSGCVCEVAQGPLGIRVGGTGTACDGAEDDMGSCHGSLFLELFPLCVTDWSLLLSVITMWTAFAKHDLLL